MTSKATRTLNYTALDASCGRLFITITTGSKVEESSYWIECVDGEDTFTITKKGETGDKGYEAPYRVCITRGMVACGCKGFEFCRKEVRSCRHLDSIRVLRARKEI